MQHNNVISGRKATHTTIISRIFRTVVGQFIRTKLRECSGVVTKSTLRGRGEAQMIKTRIPNGWARGPAFLERGLTAPLHQLWALRERCELSHWVWGEAPAAKNFGAFWVFQVNCPAVLLCKTVCRPPIQVYNLMHLHASHNSFKKIYTILRIHNQI